MKKEINLISKIPPSVNHYLGYRSIPKKKNNKTVYIVVPYLTKEAKDYKSYFTKYAKEQVEKINWDIEKTRDRHYYMDCVYYFPRTDMDEQNYPKVMSDALNGVVYIDDKNILTRTNRIYYDNINPRVEIVIRPVEYIGVFDNQDQLNTFIKTCETCKRYKNNCSILKKAIEGRIQEELDIDLKCDKYKRKE